jgi:rubrerythrin
MVLQVDERADLKLRPLKDCKTLGAVLNTAMAFEKTGAEFYRVVAGRLDEDVRPLVEQLARETEEQYQRLRAMAEDRQLADHLDHLVTRPEGCSECSQFASLPDLRDDALDDDVLGYALDLERVALEHYLYLQDEVRDHLLSDLFAYLAREKSLRVNRLEKRWVTLFSVL